MSWKSTALILAVTITPRSPVAAAERITPPAVPAGIEAPAGTKPILRGHAIGTQNYICVQTASGAEWLFIGPQATVFDVGVQILTHFQSKNPFQSNDLHAAWQHSRDTSIAWGKKLRGSTDPTYVAPDAIEWLLLEVTGAQVGPSGGIKVSASTFIQRVNTVGGLKPPASECNASTLNTRRLVDYEADYYFYQ
jgi:Protein of unknown function (DUF3455)